MASSNGITTFLFHTGAKIKHQHLLVEMMTSLYEKSISSDVIFEVGNKEFKAHRNILAARSPVFETMLFGTAFREANNDVVALPSKNAESFEIFLKYLYTCEMQLDDLNLDTVIEIIHMAHEYQVNDLVNELANKLATIICGESVLPIFECAHLLNLEHLLEICREYLWKNASEVVNSSQIVELSKSALIDLISSDMFSPPEVDILIAVNGWQKRHDGQNVKDVLQHIRFPYITLDGMKMAKAAPLYRLLIANDIDIEILGDETVSPTFCPPRKEFAQATKKNVALVKCGRTAVGLPTPDDIDFLFSEKAPDWRGFLAYETPIVIRLSNVYRIGSMSLDIYGGSETSQQCYYKIETSENETHWKTLVDCSNRPCYRQQLILFQPRFIQYIRITAFPIIGTRSEDFAIQDFACAAEDISNEEEEKYRQECPHGKTMLYQRHSKTVMIFD